MSVNKTLIKLIPRKILPVGFKRVNGSRLDRSGYRYICLGQLAHADGHIKMGIATDITGAIGASGNTCWQVAQLAVSQINDAGGILGRPIELIFEDTA